MIHDRLLSWRGRQPPVFPRGKSFVDGTTTPKPPKTTTLPLGMADVGDEPGAVTSPSECLVRPVSNLPLLVPRGVTVSTSKTSSYPRTTDSEGHYSFRTGQRSNETEVSYSSRYGSPVTGPVPSLPRYYTWFFVLGRKCHRSWSPRGLGSETVPSCSDKVSCQPWCRLVIIHKDFPSCTPVFGDTSRQEVQNLLVSPIPSRTFKKNMTCEPLTETKLLL